VIVFSFAIVLVNAAQADTASTVHPASARRAGSFANLIEEASRRFAIPAHWIRAVMTVESAGDVRARSPKGAMGLMQIMPETWADLRMRYRLGSDPYDSRDNILAGAAYLHELHDRYGSPGFPAAYNAGPGRYEQYLAGRTLPAETRAYVATLAPSFGGAELTSPLSVATVHAKLWIEAPLFIGRPERATAADRVLAERRLDRAPASNPMRKIPALVPQARSLFVIRSSAGDLQ
jgi:membrane-bound lytic murein transglycosylase B